MADELENTEQPPLFSGTDAPVHGEADHVGTKRIDEIEAASNQLPNEDYIVQSLEDEDVWEVILADKTIRIENPVSLIIRKGGSTHCLVAEDGWTYCYPAPETGKSVIRWQAKEGCGPVAL